MQARSFVNASLDLSCSCSQKSCPFSSQHGKSGRDFSEQCCSSALLCFPHQLGQTTFESSRSWVTRASPLASGHLSLISASKFITEGQDRRANSEAFYFVQTIFLLPTSNEGSVSSVILLFCFTFQALGRLKMYLYTTSVRLKITSYWQAWSGQHLWAL